jgi:hypothetical protein
MREISFLGSPPRMSPGARQMLFTIFRNHMAGLAEGPRNRRVNER